MLFLVACWQPTAYPTPPPPQVTAAELMEAQTVTPDDGSPTASEQPTETPAAIEGADENDTARQAASPDPETTGPLGLSFDDVLVKPYRAYTVGTPLSVVNEFGQLVATIGTPGTRVTVLAEGSLRVKIRCDGCSPVVEGYLQKERVRK